MEGRLAGRMSTIGIQTMTERLSRDDLLTLHAIWKRVGTRAMIDAVRFCQHYEEVSPPKGEPPRKTRPGQI